MNAVQRAILPAFLASSLLIVMLTQLIRAPLQVQAYDDHALLSQGSIAGSPSGDLSTQEEDAALASTDPVSIPQAAAPEPVRCTLGTSYPGSIQQWCPLIESSAAQHNLDPRLIAAVMLQESGGNPDAYSHSGAVGLMQVMPRDGLAADFLCSGQPCFSNRPTMEELYDPAFNIEYGARLLARLVDNEGSLREGLRAYGPMDVGYYYADLVLDLYQSYN